MTSGGTAVKSPKIDKTLVKKLVSQHFPHLSKLPVEPIEKQGWDNKTFRLGDDLTVRLPSAQAYAAAVQKEATALRKLGPCLSVSIPEVVGLGEPCPEYPLPWSIRRWIAGQTLQDADVLDRKALASALGSVLVELRAVSSEDGMPAGKHSFFRGSHPSVYNHEVAQSLDRLGDRIDTPLCNDIWQESINSDWSDRPVWFHGDVAAGNILVNDGLLSSLIDFGTCGIGDPACDFVMAWTYFNVDERLIFRESVKVDDETWQRAKAWALWKALVCLSGLSNPDIDGTQARALNEIQNEGL